MKLLLFEGRSSTPYIKVTLENLGFEVQVFALQAGCPHDLALGNIYKQLQMFKAGGGQWVHFGVSVWASKVELYQMCEALQLTAIGPGAKVISQFSDRLNFLPKANELGIPTLALNFEPIYSVREIGEVLTKIDKPYPVILKSTQGGSVFGIQVVHRPEDLERTLAVWLEQLRLTLQDPILFLERYLEGAKLFLISFFRNAQGEVQVFPWVDGSLQVQSKKIIEVCQSLPPVSNYIKNKIETWTTLLANKFQYVGVGAVEFLIEGDQAYLLEGIPRLNTAFMLWEQVAGVSAIELQLSQYSVFAKNTGGDQRNAKSQQQCSLGLRLYAEDPVLQLPLPGHWTLSNRLKNAEFVENHLYAQGSLLSRTDSPTLFSDSGTSGQVDWLDEALFLIFQVSEATLEACFQKVATLLEKELRVVGSLGSNQRFLLELCQHPWVKEGLFHAAFIEEEFVPSFRPPSSWLSLFPLLCLKQVGESLGGGRWIVGDQWVKLPNQELDPPLVDWQKKASDIAVGRIQVPVGQIEPFYVKKFGHGERFWVQIGLWALWVKLPESFPVLRALTSGRVHELRLRVGSEVSAHEVIALVESLGNLVVHALPKKVKCIETKVVVGQIVQAGQEIARFQIV